MKALRIVLTKKKKESKIKTVKNYGILILDKKETQRGVFP